jgi:ribonuclease G
LPDRGGYIIRTAAEGVEADEIREDIRYLGRLWAKVGKRITKSGTIKAVYSEVSHYMRTIRDLITPRVEKIRIDNKQSYDEITQFLEDYIPDLKTDVELYLGDRPIFDMYGIEDEIKKALSRKVKLKSGGDLIIDQTEAMTTIDVNTGGYLGSRNHSETILKTNLEAAKAIARQLRVRNLGGIVIVDFIDMIDPEHRHQVQRTFNKVLEKDHACSATTDLSPLGLIEMTRKRTRESLGQTLNDPCTVCAGRGDQKSAERVATKYFEKYYM